MIRLSKVCCIFSLLLCFASLHGETVSEELLNKISLGFSHVAKNATPAVVYIETKCEKKKPSMRAKKGPFENPFDFFQDDFFQRFFQFPQNEQEKLETVKGSGFFISEDGYIVTNYHVIENGCKIQVLLQNGQKVKAELIGSDPGTDLAVIKIEGKGYAKLTFADSDKIEVGEWAIACGNPFGLQATVTVGVVSAKGRSQLNISDFEDFLQTDAAINPGNSGGPLLNVYSQVIGVNTAIVSGSGGYMGIGFAIPSNMAKQIVAQLIHDGKVTRGFLGVTLQPIDSDLAHFYQIDGVYGALVTDVIKDSPAEKAGLLQEDVIIMYDDQKVDNIGHFRNIVSLMAPGSKLTLKVIRNGKEIELKLKIGEAPKNDKKLENNLPIEKLGLTVQDLDAEKKQQYKDLDGGVIVMKVVPDSPADIAGIRPGNVIVAINRKKVTSAAEFTKQLEQSAEEHQKVLLMIRQGEVVRFVSLNFD